MKTDVDSDVSSDVDSDVGRASIALVSYVVAHDMIYVLLRQLVTRRYKWLRRPIT
jgi:hypothetical protein